MTGTDLAAIEARIRAIEARTGAEVVAAVVDRCDRYHGLRWRAFAVGTSLAALLTVIADVVRPDWTGAHAALLTAVAILATGLVCTLAVTLSPAFARPLLQRERAEGEVRQRAQALFLERELFATPDRVAVLLLASRFERVVVVLGDRAYDGRVTPEEWQGVVDAMAPAFRRGEVTHAFTAGLDALEALLVEKGFRGDGSTRNILPDRPFEPAGDDR